MRWLPPNLVHFQNRIFAVKCNMFNYRRLHAFSGKGKNSKEFGALGKGCLE